MLKNILKVKELNANLDATDGLATAICHYYQEGKSVGDKKYTGWKAFLSDNPKKMK